MRRALTVVCLVGALQVGCMGDDERAVTTTTPPAAPFTVDAAREALRATYTPATPGEFCGYLTPRMQDLILTLMRRESGITETECVAAMEAAARQGGEEGETAEAVAAALGSHALTPEDREEIRADPHVDEERRTVAFLNEFRSGPVMQHVDGRWLLAGVATGG